MTLNFGLHSGPQNIDIDELKQLWKRADEAGFYWVSVWDHFYANPISDRNIPCFEAIAAMTALALTTRRVRVGCLVFAMPFRQPGQLAKAVATIDHLSDGQAWARAGCRRSSTNTASSTSSIMMAMDARSGLPRERLPV